MARIKLSRYMQKSFSKQGHIPKQVTILKKPNNVGGQENMFLLNKDVHIILASNIFQLDTLW